MLRRFVEGELSVIDRRRLQAPSSHGAILAEPPLAEAGRLLADNRQRFDQSGRDILGRSWADIRRQARQDVLAAAKDYFIQAGEPVPTFKADTLILAGHQPDLFHPGVWLKNFALNGLAKTHGAMPLNLIVDSDAVKTLAIRLPMYPARMSQPGNERIDPDQLKMVTIPIDRWTREVPYEELRVADEATFAGVESEAASILRTWGFEPILGPYWREAVTKGQRTPVLGERLAAARRTFERKWDCHNLELPVSRVCQTPSFVWFALHLVANLPEFHAIYNGSLRDYRHRYGLHSKSHPVPELAAENGWREAPFWAWRADQPRRRPLFARLTDAGIELRLDNEKLPALPLESNPIPRLAGAAQAISAWQELERQGIKIRSRALITTLFARLFLGELFIHGIGGGKYDELTDAIIHDFYQVEPPEYLVLSGTLLLPLPALSARQPDCRRWARQLRDLRWNPERHLGEQGALPGPFPSAARFEKGDLIAEKASWVARQPQNNDERRRRFQSIRELTSQLRPLVREREQQVRELLRNCEREVEANRILQNREYAFCLHPEGTLRPFLTQFM